MSRELLGYESNRRARIIGSIGYMGGVMSTPEPFTFSWGNMLVYSQEALCNPGEHIHPVRAKSSLHDFARTELVAAMKGDWLLMLDTDVAFEPDFAARLVGTMNRYRLDIVTGIYSYKTPPHAPVVYMFNHESQRHEQIVEWDRSTEIFNVDSAGGGCLLVRRSVFERITHAFRENAFARMGTKGEDHSFFTRARELGIQAWCAWKVEMQHLDYRGILPSVDFTMDVDAPHQYETAAFQLQSGQPGEKGVVAWQ